MPLQCNIDAKGKTVRLINGIVLIVVGLILLFAVTLRYGGAIPWMLTILLFICGAFSIFEARAGWCIIRAMGGKTPI
jgi:uncharacterized membrane protein HdeD (DUF308 family)